MVGCTVYQQKRDMEDARNERPSTTCRVTGTAIVKYFKKIENSHNDRKRAPNIFAKKNAVSLVQ